MVYIFDGTYGGLLSAVFEAFANKEFSVTLSVEEQFQPAFFDGHRTVETDRHKVQRILTGLEKHLARAQVMDLWKAFLAEDLRVSNTIFRLMITIFRGNPRILHNYGDEDALYLSQTLRKISRERHRMKAFIRFQKSDNGMYVAVVEPDFNVLPLIIPFFGNRYSDQPWLIYDAKRKYGIHYDLSSVTEVTLSPQQANALATHSSVIELDPKDSMYEQLWHSYFKSTNIEARKNLKLHLRHVPKRYWKYLPEKMNELKSG